MSAKNLTDEQYESLLWEEVLKIASKKVSGKKSKNNIFNEISAETGIEAQAFARHEKGKTKKWRDDSLELLSVYVGSETFAKFKEKINLERESRGDVYWKIMEIIEGNVFLSKTYSALSTSSLITNNKEFTVDDSVLFFRFIKSLNLAYTDESLFNSLSIVPDRSNLIGKIPMRDYFIQLSYVTKTEIKTRESLVRNETELNILKIRRSIESNQQLTKDYIVNFSLQNIQNLLVLGNPGVGKSTFCRWLCHEWTLNPKTTNTIPVYIQLKGLEFEIGRNSIINYIHRNYLIGDSSDTGHMHAVLRKMYSFVCFVLDGFDELSEPQKDELFRQLHEISSNCKYILASRPYGILKKYEDLKWDQLIQLDGFDTSNINNYIDAFVQKNSIAKAKSKEQLIEIIEINPILTDFAHNPLMLSFIVYIYLSDDNADDILRKIQTRFDLQQVVIGWMFIHNRLKVSVELDDRLIHAISKIANEMEFGKTAERTGRLTDKDFQSVLLPMSQLGIGQLTESNLGTYKFYFNSITFQEYFAAISIAGNITSAALEYLLQDSYFWNLAAMILGQISSESTSAILDGLLATCEEELLVEEREYIYYKYLLLLSECRANYLNRKMGHSVLQTINKAFAKNIQNAKNKDSKSEHLKYAFAECTQRIYNKMDEVHKKQFKELLFREIEISWKNPNDPLLKWDASCRHLPILVKYLDLNLDISFTTSCLNLLITSLEEYKEDKCDFSALWDFPDFAVSILQNNPENFFLITRTLLEKVLPLIPTSFLNFRGRIELHYTSAKIALLRLSNTTSVFNPTDDDLAKEKLIVEISVYSFIVGRKIREFETEKDIAQSQHQLMAAAQIVYNYLSSKEPDYSPNYVDLNRPVAQLITEGLFESDNYAAATDILSCVKEEYLFFDQMIQTNLHNYFDEIVGKTTHTDAANLKHICTMIYCIPALKNKIAFHRNKIADLVNSYIDKNSEIFRGLTSASETDYFFWLLERGEQDIYENDRRFFVEVMLTGNMAKLPHFRKTLLPRIIRKHIIIYNSTYWNFIISFLNENDENSIGIALTMFLNPSIYQYAINLPYIQRLFTFLIQIRSQPFYDALIKSQAENILTITGNTLIMLKQANITTPLMLNQILPFTGEILKQPAVKKEIQDNLGKIRQTGACNSAFILQYYFSGDPAFDLNINYWQAFHKGNHRKTIVEYIYPAFVQCGGLPESEINKIKEVTGDEFIQELRNQQSRMKVHQFPFVKEEFTSLCS